MDTSTEEKVTLVSVDIETYMMHMIERKSVSEILFYDATQHGAGAKVLIHLSLSPL